MSKLTNWGENKLIDRYLRNQAWTLPTGWWLGLATSADDGTITECTGTGYARKQLLRTQTVWSGTQGTGSTTPSSGTSHRTSNNMSIDFGTSGAAWGNATHLVLFDASTAGNAFIYATIEGGFDISAGGISVAFDAGTLNITIGVSGGMSDYLANKIIDEVFRGIAFSTPGALYARLLTIAPTNAGGGVEVSAPGYSRVGISRALTAWAGTQAAGSTAASTGTSGQTSNNASIVWPAPTSSWGTVTHFALNDNSLSGNLWFWGTLVPSRSIAATAPAPSIPIGDLTITFD